MAGPKVIESPQVHLFDSTWNAYDSVNTEFHVEWPEGDKRVKVSDGDVLVVASEGVIGIAVSAWPTAVVYAGDETGQFHTFAPGVDLSCFGKSDENVTEYMVKGEMCRYVIKADPGTDYRKSIKLAKETALSDADITGNLHWAEVVV